MKTPFVSKEQVDLITEQFSTPFHLYDEKGIRETARAVNAAFSWNEGFKEYFAVKATPNPTILKILKEEGVTYEAVCPKCYYRKLIQYKKLKESGRI